MPLHDPRLTTVGESRNARQQPLSWSSIWAGTLIGQASLFVLSLLGASLAGVDRVRGAVFGDRLGYLGLGASGVGVLAMAISALLGAFLIVRIAGERRRREAFLHGAVGWGLSTVALGALSATATGGLGLTARALATAAGTVALTLVFSLLGAALGCAGGAHSAFADEQPPPPAPRPNLSDFEVKPSRPTIIPPLH